MAANRAVSVLEILDATHVNAHGRIELERAAAGGYLRIAVHDADLFAQLVDEDCHALGLGNDARQLAQRLTHQTGVQTDKRIAHLAFDFGARNQCRYRVNDDDVQRARTHQLFGNFQALIAAVRLRYQQAVHVNAERRRIRRVQRVFGVDKRRNAAVRLCRCNRVQGEGGFTGRFRSVNLDDSAARQAADAQRHVQTNGAGGDDVLVLLLDLLTEEHDGVFAVLLFNLCQRLIQRLLFIGCYRNGRQCFFLRHDLPPAVVKVFPRK